MGFFITFEGVEGCGKTTQIELLKGHLEKKGLKVLAVREPGGTKLGEKIRAALLSSTEEPVDPWAELFLYEACRAMLVKKVIKPALDAGTVVICDRYTDSTLAYQGYGRNIDLETIKYLSRLSTHNLVPDVTILLDLGAEAGLERAFKRIEDAEGPKEDRFEKEELLFHRRVREGYLKIAAAFPARIKVVDAGGEIPSIQKSICDIMNKVLLGPA